MAKIVEVGLSVLSPSGFGKIDLPIDGLEGLRCPQCGTSCEGGTCTLEFGLRPNPNEALATRAPLVLMLIVNCRTCGNIGDSPAELFFDQPEAGAQLLPPA